ncbi:MAG: DUF2958 domain-containing protein [Candidatus Omnitrophota bacterium]
MWNKPSIKELEKIPKFYETEDVSAEEKDIHMHFFLGGCDWYVAEYDAEKELFFGFAILNNDYQMAEWGYISFKELCDLSVKGIEVDRDLYFESRKAKNVEKIKMAMKEVEA